MYIVMFQLLLLPILKQKKGGTPLMHILMQIISIILCKQSLMKYLISGDAIISMLRPGATVTEAFYFQPER